MPRPAATEVETAPAAACCRNRLRLEEYSMGLIPEREPRSRQVITRFSGQGIRSAEQGGETTAGGESLRGFRNNSKSQYCQAFLSTWRLSLFTRPALILARIRPGSSFHATAKRGATDLCRFATRLRRTCSIRHSASCFATALTRVPTTNRPRKKATFPEHGRDRPESCLPIFRRQA